VNFEKYCASGNDFLITHTFLNKDYSGLAKKLCDRHYGFGADGLIVLIPSREKGCSFEWLFYNADGSVASMCGNGARATALYAYDNSIVSKKLSFKTGAGVIKAQIFTKDVVQTQLTPIKIVQKSIKEDGKEWMLLDSGVPHLCAFVDDIEKFDLAKARALRQKHNANVNIYAKKDGVIFVRTYERGVEDETLACGTGMCACVFAAKIGGILKQDSAKVHPLSKEEIEVKIDGEIAYLKGAVRHIGSCLQKV